MWIVFDTLIDEKTRDKNQKSSWYEMKQLDNEQNSRNDELLIHKYEINSHKYVINSGSDEIKSQIKATLLKLQDKCQLWDRNI